MAQLNIHVGERVFEDWGKNTVLTSEAIAIEKAYGKTFGQFCQDLDGGSIYAKQILAWSLLRRDDPSLKLNDVDLPIGEIDLDPVCDSCKRSLAPKIVDGELVMVNGTLARVHADDNTDECGIQEEVPEDDPFSAGSPEG